MSIRQMSKREQGIFIITLLAGLSYFVVYGVVKPFGEKKEALVAQIEAKQSVLDKYVKTIQRAKALEKENEVLFAQFKQPGANEQVMSQLLSEIESKSAELGLRISELKPRRVKKEDAFNRFSVSLSLECSLVNMLQLLYALQKDPHFFKIDEFVIEKGLQRQADTVKVHLVLSKMFISQP